MARRDEDPAARAVRRAWLDVVRASDYDQHMMANGQASANAALVSGLLEDPAVRARSSVLVPGAGTGQFLELMGPAAPGHLLTCTDLRLDFLVRLRARLGPRVRRLRVLVDDLESSAISGAFDGAIVVLVLEHVAWRDAVRTLSRLDLEWLIVVIQKMTGGAGGPLRPGDPAVGTMDVFKTARPTLIDPEALTGEFAAAGFAVVARRSIGTGSGKEMYGVLYSRTSKEPA